MERFSLRAAKLPRTRLALFLAVWGIGLGVSCTPDSAPPRILTVEPSSAFTDQPVVLRIDAPNVRPSLRIDVNHGTLTTDLTSLRMTLAAAIPATGAEPVALETVDWDAQEYVWARTPTNLLVGRYDLTLVDPRGKPYVFQDAFESLGPDTTPPTIQLKPALAPNSVLGEGQTVVATVVADDGIGRLQQVHWETTDNTVGDCPPRQDTSAAATAAAATSVSPHYAPPSQIACPVRFTIPNFAGTAPSILPFAFHASARDVAGNQVALDIPLRIARQPVIASFSDTVGALGGYQPFTVQGRGFIAGSRALLDGVPIVGTTAGGDVASDTVIVGWTPPRNRVGPVRVQVISDGGAATAAMYFNYLPPPLPRDVQPNRGPSAGGFRVTITGNDFRDAAIAFMGTTRNTRQPLTSARHNGSNKISACVPPGSGTVALWIYDPITGDGLLPTAFTYDDGTDVTVPPPDPTCP